MNKLMGVERAHLAAVVGTVAAYSSALTIGFIRAFIDKTVAIPEDGDAVEIFAESRRRIVTEIPGGKIIAPGIPVNAARFCRGLWLCCWFGRRSRFRCWCRL